MIDYELWAMRLIVVSTIGAVLLVAVYAAKFAAEERQRSRELEEIEKRLAKETEEIRKQYVRRP